MNWNYKKLISDKKPSDFRKNFKFWKFPKIPVNKPTQFGWRVFGFDETNPEKLKIGFGSDISTLSILFAHEGITIEPFVQIGPHCTIMSKSTIDNKSGEVHLKTNCRIGAYTTIMPGVTIGQNSIVGAYSFVNIDIPDNVIAHGIPCKIVKSLNRNLEKSDIS